MNPQELTFTMKDVGWLVSQLIVLGVILWRGGAYINKIKQKSKDNADELIRQKEATEKELTLQKENFEKEIQASNIAKHSRIKEMKADFRERIQICHDRIDKQRDFVEKQGEKVEHKIDELKRHVDASNIKVIETVTNAIATALKK